MSEHVTLTLRAPLEQTIDATCIRPDAFAPLNEREISALPVWSGRAQHTLGDYFAVRGGTSSRVRVIGDVRSATEIGAGMTGGELIVEGNAGSGVGTGMTGGSIHVRGNVGDRIGAASPGAARGMSGGEIVVEGSAGSDAGARMRRGLLFVGGNVGDRSARAMIAGTVIVIGRVGAEPAHGNKRGTLVAGDGMTIPVTYRYACDYQPPHVRLALTYLARRYGLPIYPRLIDGRYSRYCGDAGTVAKGEILEWLPE
jgi:formylmethanofuran dehydrogenase subunit C